MLLRYLKSLIYNSVVGLRFMKYRVKIFSILSALPILVFAAPSDHGRPWDDPSYHSSPLSKIFGLIAIIILIILTIGLAIGWIGSNKEKIGGILKSLFSIICGGLFIFGIIILPLLDRCGRVSSTQSPQEGEVGYKTQTYRIVVCQHCHGSGEIEPNWVTKEPDWGTETIRCPICHGTGREKISSNYR